MSFTETNILLPEEIRLFYQDKRAMASFVPYQVDHVKYNLKICKLQDDNAYNKIG